MTDMPVTPFPEDLVYSDMIENNIPQHVDDNKFTMGLSPNTVTSTTAGTTDDSDGTESPWLTSAGREIRASFLFQSSCYLPDYDGTESETSGTQHTGNQSLHYTTTTTTNTPKELVRAFHHHPHHHRSHVNKNRNNSSSSTGTAIMQSTSFHGGIDYLKPITDVPGSAENSQSQLSSPTESTNFETKKQPATKTTTTNTTKTKERRVMFYDDGNIYLDGDTSSDDGKSFTAGLGYQIAVPLHQAFHSLPAVTAVSNRNSGKKQQKFRASTEQKVGDDEEMFSATGLQSRTGVSTLTFNNNINTSKSRRRQLYCYLLLIFMAMCFMSIAVGCGIRQCGRSSESPTSIEPPLPQNDPLAPAATPFIPSVPTSSTIVPPTVEANSLPPTLSPTPPKVIIQTTEELYAAVDAYLSGEWNMTDTANTPIGYWDVSQITNFSFVFNAFRNPSVINFNEDINDWDTSSAITMESMFYGAEKFNGNVSSWNTSNVENMKEMFAKTSRFIGRSVSTWDVSKVTTMEGMFRGANRFQGNLRQWKTSSVQNMANMFLNCNAFTGNGVETWDTSNVRDMSMMFRYTPYFNGQISSWNVGQVTNMRGMFRQAVAFTGDLSQWDLRSVTDISQMFMHAVRFNADISRWNTSSLTTTSEAFFGAISFNGDISEWDVSKVVDLTSMFAGAVRFDQDLCPWIKLLPSPEKLLATTRSMFVATSCPEPVLPGSVEYFGVSFCYLCNSSIVLNVTDGPNWTPPTNIFNRDGYKSILTQQELHKAVDEYLQNNTNSTSVALTYGHPIRNWNVSQVANFSRTFDAERNPLAASFTEDLDMWDTSSAVSMSRMFAGASWFNGNISSWSTGTVTTMERMFQNAFSFNGDLSQWNTSSCLSMASMFEGADQFNRNLSTFDTSNVLDMSGMFCSAISFQGIGLADWNTASVTTMRGMFEQTFSFTSVVLSSWNVSNVVDMSAIFQHSSFNGDISDWNVEEVVTFHSAFGGAGAFNQDLSPWNVSSALIFSGMFAGAKGFNQNLCSWRPLLESSGTIRVSGMFASSACSNPADPNVEDFEPIESVCRTC